MSYETTYHRDGTVTVWDVYSQQWTRRSATDLAEDMQVLPTLSDAERERIYAMAHGMTVRQYRRAAALVDCRVEAGHGEDHDTGRVERIMDADTLYVSWDSGVKTPAAISDLRRL